MPWHRLTFKSDFTKVTMRVKQCDSFNRPTLQPHSLPRSRLLSPNTLPAPSSPISPIPTLDYGLLSASRSGNMTCAYITDAWILTVSLFALLLRAHCRPQITVTSLSPPVPGATQAPVTGRPVVVCTPRIYSFNILFSSLIFWKFENLLICDA